jgi:hypothetical protein
MMSKFEPVFSSEFQGSLRLRLPRANASGMSRSRRVRFPDANRLLITADAGGSNSYRVRAWKVELAALAKETGRT